jgi:hypothetical protein
VAYASYRRHSFPRNFHEEYVVAIMVSGVERLRHANTSELAPVAGYFLQGMYTLQDWLNAVSPRLPWLIPAGSLAVLVLAGVTLAAARRLPRARLFAVTAVTSVFWTYHNPYDFVVLLPVLLPLAGWSDLPPGRRWAPVGVALYAVLAVALTPLVTAGTDPATRGLRWVARVVVIGLFVQEYLRAWWSVFHPIDPDAGGVKMRFKAETGG